MVRTFLGTLVCNLLPTNLPMHTHDVMSFISHLEMPLNDYQIPLATQPVVCLNIKSRIRSARRERADFTNQWISVSIATWDSASAYPQVRHWVCTTGHMPHIALTDSMEQPWIFGWQTGNDIRLYQSLLQIPVSLKRLHV